MDFELDDTQAALVDLIETLLNAKAGPARARIVLEGAGYDIELERALDDAELLDLLSNPDAGPLASAIVAERVAAHAGVVAYGARALVAEGLGVDVEGPIALTTGAVGEPVRFGAQAATALVLGGSRAMVTPIIASEHDVRTFGFPVAAITLGPGQDLGEGSAERMLAWWRVAITTEIVGLAEAALRLTCDHVTGRYQFGRPIGSLQAVQHRLATVYVHVEGARWLGRYAAFTGADTDAASTAATYAATLARTAIWELHQLTGATGFTQEYDLHLLTMRLHALRLELNGVSGSHARAVATQRWFDADALTTAN